MATCGYFMRYSAVMPGLLWHLAQVRGRLSLKTGESACLTGCISCEPWQSTQDGGGRTRPWPCSCRECCRRIVWPRPVWQEAHWAGGRPLGCTISLMRIVAIGAVEFGVDRFREGVGWKKRHRHRFPVHRARGGRVRVAVQTILIGQRARPPAGQTSDSQKAMARAVQKRIFYIPPLWQSVH